MKKNILIILLLSSFLTMSMPCMAFIHLGVQKDNQQTTVKQNTKNKQNIKTTKPKKKSWTKLRVKNKYEFINIGYWDNFNDEYLTTYIQKAIENNYNLKVASLNVDEYYHTVQLQRAGELPVVGAGLSPGYGKGNDWFMSLPILVNYEADIFLKNHDKTRAVKKAFEASIQDERAAYISVVAAVGTTYYNIVQLDKLIENQTTIVKLRQDIYEAMNISNKEGIASTSDLIKANKNLVAGETVLIEYKKARVKALNQLAVLIGESPKNIDNLKRISYDNIEYNYIMPKDIPSEIIVNRPDYLKAELMLQKSGIDVRVAKKEFLPSISIGGLYMFNLIRPANLLPANLYGIGGNIFESITLGGARIAKLKINKVRYEKMLKTYYNTNLTSIQEINDAMYTYKYNNDKYLQNMKNLAFEEKDFNLSTQKYEQGVISKLDLNQREENLLDIKNLIVKNKTDCLIDSIGFYKATGAVSAEDIVKKTSVIK